MKKGCCVGRRAISEQQKEARRQTILDAAARLFQATNYDDVVISEVAKEAGIAKGTVYLYFGTKEELFLALLTQSFEDWFDEIDAGLSEMGASCSIDSFVKLVGHTLSRRPHFTRLVAILHTILERNIDYATALAFKEMLRRRVLKTGPLLESCLSFLEAGQGGQVLLRMHAMVIGFQHVASPAPVVRDVLTREAGLELFEIDFTAELLVTLRAMLLGLERTNTIARGV